MNRAYGRWAGQSARGGLAGAGCAKGWLSSLLVFPRKKGEVIPLGLLSQS